jgi:hypothetical protein
MHRSTHDEGGVWATPEHVQVSPRDATSLAVDMAYSSDGNRLYFLGNHPHPRSPTDTSNDIWVSERTEDGGWSFATHWADDCQTGPHRSNRSLCQLALRYGD